MHTQCARAWPMYKHDLHIGIRRTERSDVSFGLKPKSVNPELSCAS